MEIHEQKAQKRTDGEEDLLNFDLDDLSLEEVDQATAGEEEVIELTDLVEKGSVPAKDSQDEIARLLQEEDAGGGTADIELATKEFAGLNGIQKEKRKEKAESLLDMDDLSLDFSEEEKAPVGEKVVEQEISDSDLAEILKEEGAENLDLGTEEVVVAEDRLQEEVISDADLAAVEDSLPTQELSAMLAPKPSAPKEMVLDLLEEAVVEPEPISPPAAERPIFVPEAPAPGGVRSRSPSGSRRRPLGPDDGCGDLGGEARGRREEGGSGCGGKGHTGNPGGGGGESRQGNHRGGGGESRQGNHRDGGGEGCQGDSGAGSGKGCAGNPDRSHGSGYHAGH